MVRPLGAAMIPVMLAVLAAVLAEQRIWPYVLWASGGALAVAWVWVRFQLGRTPAELRVRPHQRAAALLSVRDVLRDAPPAWQYLVRLRRERMPSALRVDLGDTAHRLLGKQWPRADALEDALRRAARASR